MTLKQLPKYCHCGKLMHLSDSQKIMIKQWGRNWSEYKKVIMAGAKSYKVPSYYILLHGITYKELPDLGFEEWPINLTI